MFLKPRGLPGSFRYHDLRHYFASLLIASGADVKVVQARLRHATAKTTLDTYGHLWPDRDESTRATVDAVLQERHSALADSLRTSRERSDVLAGQSYAPLSSRSTARIRAGAAAA